MKNETIVILSLAAACSDWELREIAEPVMPVETTEGLPPLEIPERGTPVQPPCAVVDLVLVAATPSPHFQTDGVLELVLLPRDADGNLLLDCDWSVVAGVDGDVGAGVTSVLSVPQDPMPTAFALDLDSSGSMASADPQMTRVGAAQDFIGITELARPDNVHGVFTFPRDGFAPFAVTETLAAFTDDGAAASAAVAQVGAPGGTTPLFESAIEVLDHQDDVVGSAYRTSLVLFSDGEPGDRYYTIDDLLAAAAATGTTIPTIGLGGASQTSDSPDLDAVDVMQRLAFETNGSFSSATESGDLETAFANLAASVSGHIVVTVVFTAPPPSGSFVSGTISVEHAGSTWSFIAP
jgi:hypothetical protein